MHSYTTYNNPYLCEIMGQTLPGIAYYNLSGLTLGYGKIDQLLQNNSVLSMLGVRYIEDTRQVLPQISTCVINHNQIERCFYSDESIIPVCTGDYEFKLFDVQVQKHKYYRVSFEAETDTTPDLFYIDLYGVDKDTVYDNEEQQQSIALKSGKHRYAVYLYSGDQEIPEDTVVRMISVNASDIAIRNLQIDEMGVSNDVYIPFNNDPSTGFYVNTRARDILYKADRVEGIPDIMEISICPDAYDFNTSSYIEGGETYDYSGTTTEITDVKWESNHRLRGTVISDGDAFINFSQCYDPDWHVFVDGIEQKNYQTNLAIQGVFIDKGAHEIIYDYKPKAVYISMIVSVLTVTACLGYLLIESGKRSKEKNKRASAKE